MKTTPNDAGRALALASLLLCGCFGDPIDCPGCADDTGQPGAPGIEITKDGIDFGELPLGETARESLGVGNPGTAGLVLTAISVTEPFVARYDNDLTVSPNSSAMLFVELTPSEPAELVGTLSFSWNDPDAGEGGSLVEIPITATVLGDPPAR